MKILFSLLFAAFTLSAHAAYTYMELFDPTSDLNRTEVVGIDSGIPFGTYTDTNGGVFDFVYAGANSYFNIGNGEPGIIYSTRYEAIGNEGDGNSWYQYLNGVKTVNTNIFTNSQGLTVTDADTNHVIGSVSFAGVPYGFVFDGTNYTFVSAPYATMGTIPSSVAGDLVAGTFIDVNNYDNGFLYSISNATYTTFNHPLGTFGTTVVAAHGSNVIGTYINDAQETNSFLCHGTNFYTINVPAAYNSGNVAYASVSNSAILADVSDYGAVVNYLYTKTPYHNVSVAVTVPSTNGSNATKFTSHPVYGATTTNSGSFFVNNLGQRTLFAYPGNVRGTKINAIDGLDIVGNFYDARNLPHSFFAPYTRIASTLTIALGSKTWAPSIPVITKSSAGLPVNVSLLSTNLGSLSNSMLIPSGSGLYRFAVSTPQTATMAAEMKFSSFFIDPAKQVVTFPKTNIPSALLTNIPIPLATSSSGYTPLGYAVKGPAYFNTNNGLYFTNYGTVSITAIFPNSPKYSSAKATVVYTIKKPKGL